MTVKKNFSKIHPKAQKPTPCESCLYYDYNEDDDLYDCVMHLDEDEYLRFISRGTDGCPYYKLYDEYKSVQRQN